jgi:hypothetical protein
LAFMPTSVHLLCIKFHKFNIFAAGVSCSVIESAHSLNGFCGVI